jgi:thioredoxin 1
MTFKPFAIVLLLSGLAFCQFPPPVSEDNAPFDSSYILFDQIIKSKVPVLIDFWAVWCMPCRMLSPTIETLKKKYAGRLKVMKINVDVDRKLAAYFSVSAIPAVFFVKDKVVVLYLQGLHPVEDYESAINRVLNMKPAKPDTTARKSKQGPSSPSSGNNSDSTDLQTGAKAVQQQ